MTPSNCGWHHLLGHSVLLTRASMTRLKMRSPAGVTERTSILSGCESITRNDAARACEPLGACL